jgi:hypothetical protein
LVTEKEVAMVLKMSQFGSSLCTRDMGRAAFEIINDVLSGSSDRVVFDFCDVNSVTNSFADEVFGRLVFQHGFDMVRARTHFENVDRFSAVTIRTAMARRESVAALA